jgi:hypothetical protein
MRFFNYTSLNYGKFLNSHSWRWTNQNRLVASAPIAVFVFGIHEWFWCIVRLLILMFARYYSVRRGPGNFYHSTPVENLIFHHLKKLKDADFEYILIRVNIFWTSFCPTAMRIKPRFCGNKRHLASWGNFVCNSRHSSSKWRRP